MKLLFVCLLSFIFQTGFSQIDTSKKLSPVTLDTLLVLPKSKKIIKVHLKGYPSYSGLSQTTAVVSYAGNLPRGLLKSVSFYFNCGLVNHLKKRCKINYKDVELGLLIYKANSDSTIGDVISQNDIKFIVTSEHRGQFKVDVRSLKVRENSIFIGFSVLSKLPKDENNIYVRYNETKTARSYVKMDLPYMSDNWRKPFTPYPSELKLNLEILQ